MHVAYIVGRYPKLSEQFIAREIGALRQLGIEVSVFSMRRPPPGTTAPGVIYCTFADMLRGYFRSPWKSLAAEAEALWLSARHCSGEPYRGFLSALALRGIEPREGRRWDRVHAAFAGVTATAANVYGRISGCRWTFAAHARDALVRPIRLRQKIAAADAAIACTEHVAAVLSTQARPPDREKVHVVRHGLPAALLQQLQEGSAGKPKGPGAHLLSVGRLVPKKGFVHLLAAVKLLHRRGIALSCTVVGDGPQRRTLARAVAASGLDEVVTLAGARSAKDVPQAYLGADVFALPCVVAADGDRDGLPNVLLEAAAARLPIVTTPVGGIGEFVRDGETGLLVEPGDAAALADAIERLIGDAQLRLRLGEQARREVEHRFRAEANARQLATILGWLTLQDSPDG